MFIDTFKHTNQQRRLLTFVHKLDIKEIQNKYKKLRKDY